MELFFIVQIDRDGKVLGIREVHYQQEDADCALACAFEDCKQDATGWPIWAIIQRKCEDL